ncbi:MAG: DNA-directed RNA polymerase subunit K [Candidatus Heimdallarchaeum endolithica]|uniref:DNA-directed RNA polymerase subunit Rpo6 n=1 Tax=Candidatus Heimdallarchaeum endolithica TaxID=2876572 RepID=A0A9Y1BQP0_9ARCH|nr:MAG: DNA-directed RNA polymerase subunit K [Candidatus Heimdallarchaeum endolithica]
MTNELNDKQDDLEIISDKIVVGPDRLTRFERARIIGARALQLSMGAPVLLNLENADTKSPIVIAELELRAKILPISIRREFPNKTYQIIPIQKLRDIQAIREL